MHTLVATLIGLVALGLFVGLAQRKDLCAARFIPVWALICLLHFCYGVWSAGHPFLLELGVHVIVFGVPGGAAWWMSRKFKPKPKA